MQSNLFVKYESNSFCQMHAQALTQCLTNGPHLSLPKDIRLNLVKKLVPSDWMSNETNNLDWLQ